MIHYSFVLTKYIVQFTTVNGESLMFFDSSHLTHWGRVTHICVGNLTIIGSNIGLSSGRCQAIIWTNAGILFIGPLGTNFSEILAEIICEKRPFCLGLNVLMSTMIGSAVTELTISHGDWLVPWRL